MHNAVTTKLSESRNCRGSALACTMLQLVAFIMMFSLSVFSRVVEANRKKDSASYRKLSLTVHYLSRDPRRRRRQRHCGANNPTGCRVHRASLSYYGNLAT